MKASSLSFLASVIAAVTGMAWGLIMGISENHVTMPAHAHLNLLGWVSLFLIGIFYHLHPALDQSRIALVQVCVWIAGTVILTLGVAMLMSGIAVGNPFAAVGSLIVLAAMILFGWLVFQREFFPDSERSAAK
jgi:cbb3-type cytochrome oxidase subunit 1